MNNDSHLSIIDALEKASTEQLQAMARIEAAILGNQVSPPATDNEINQPVKTSRRKGKRKSQYKAPEPGTDLSSSDTVPPHSQIATGQAVAADAMEKIAGPLEEKISRQAAIPAAKVVSVSAIGDQAITTGDPISLTANERTAKAKAASGLDRDESIIKALRATITGAQAANADTLSKPLKSLEKAIAANTATVIKATKKEGPKRGADGRFVSKSKAEEVRNEQKKKRDDKNAKDAEGKQEEGFLFRLKNALGEGPEVDENQSADMAGTAAGGVAWHMARGAWDVGSTVYNNAKSVSEWRKEHFGKEESVTRVESEDEASPETQGNLALKPQPKPPIVLPAVPVQGQAVNQSSGIFHESAAQAEVKATHEQTKTITEDGTAILKNQEDELDLLKKIAENTANDSSKGIGRNLFDKLFRREGRRGRRGKSFRERFSRKSESRQERKPASGKTEKVQTGKGKESPKSTEQPKSAERPKSTVKVAEPPAGKDKPAPKLAEVSRETPTTAKNGGMIKRIPEKAITVEPASNEAVFDAVKKPLLTETAKEGIKTGAKSAVRLGVRALPVIGTAAGVAWDAADGYNDTDGQKKAFNLKGGEQATTRQKTEMSAANIAGMGGLVPLVSDGLSWGANRIGLTHNPDALSVSTPQIARGIDNGVSAIGDTARSIVRWFTQDDTNNDQITNAVKAGTADTVSAIDRLSRQLQGGRLGEDGVGQSGTLRSDYAAPTKDAITLGPNGLNIGGSHSANRNFRNNNFGNLNFANQDGAVLEDAPANGKARFARFATPEDGFRALADQITRYSDGTSKAAGYQKINTVQGIISKWAPESENDTGKYIQTIADNMGVKPGDTINTGDPEVMTRLIRSIATYEGGNPQVTDDYIKRSIGHKDDNSHKWVGGSYSKESAEYMAKHGIKGSADALPVTVSTAVDAIHSGGKKNPNRDINAVSSGTENIPAGTATPKRISDTPETDNKKSISGAGIKAGEKNIPNGIKNNPVNIPSVNPAPVASPTANSPAVTTAHPGWLTSLSQHAAKSDTAITDFVARTTGASIGFRRPTSELTLPKNATDADIPAGLRPAFSSELKHRTADIHKTWAPDTVEAPTAERQPVPASSPAQASSPAPVSAPVGSFDNPVSAAGGINQHTGAQVATGSVGLFPQGDVVPASMLNRAIPVTGSSPVYTPRSQAATAQKGSQGLMSGVGSFLSDSWQNIKTATPEVLSAVGHAALPMAQDALSGAVSGLGGRATGGISSPVISSLASPFINQGVSMAQSAIQQPQRATSMLSMPSVLPTVTNLAKSGVVDVAGRAARNVPGDSGKLLQQLVSLTRQLVDEQKKDTKDNRPDVVVNGGQKAPKHDDKYSDSALESLLED